MFAINTDLIPEYAAIQEEILNITWALGAKAAEEEDVDFLECIVHDMQKNIEFVEAAMTNRYDFDTWKSEMDRYNDMAKLQHHDKTGRIVELFKQCKDIDYREYYKVEILQIYDMNLDEIKADMQRSIDNIQAEIDRIKASRA